MKLLLIGTFLLFSTTLSTLLYASENLSVASTSKEAEGHSSNIEGLSLNNGKKWLMDDHTRKSFVEMADSFLEVEVSSLNNDELKINGASLQDRLDNLIQGCTMEGEPHEQLHTFLMGYMPEVKALSETGNVENAKNIQHYLRNYSEYFE